ncbi:sensor histidine kinase, partial [Streptomyces caelestis]
MTDHPRAAGTPPAPEATTAPPPPADGTDPGSTDPGGTAPLTRIIRGALDRLRAFDRRRPRVWDAAVTAFWAVAAVLDYTSGGWRTVADDDVTAAEP